MESIVSGIVSGIVSSMIVGALFYRLGGKDLKREANELRRLNILIIRALDQAEMIDVSYDETGRPTGLVFRQHTSGTVTPTGSVHMMIARADSSQEIVGDSAS